MKTGPIFCINALLLSIHGAQLVAVGTKDQIVVFPEQTGLENFLIVGDPLVWSVEGSPQYVSTIITAPQRWRQGEVFVRIKT